MAKPDSELAANLDKIHTTPLGAGRVKRNLELKTGDSVEWCREKIKQAGAVIARLLPNANIQSL